MLGLNEFEFHSKHEQLLATFQDLAFNDSLKIGAFQALIWHHHKMHRRSFPWRDQISPYRVLVSEIMLQQTQTGRVLEKFEAFVAAFPDFKYLAAAPFHDVLKLWKGLGYNRRALALQNCARSIVAEYNGCLPSEPEILRRLAGIGKATAGSIAAFAYNKPSVFIETNLRTVYIHFFFEDRADVHDKELEGLIGMTLDERRPREWYYALMDYGVMLKKSIGNVSRRSSHYAKQSKFEGSDRQIRGKILQVLLDESSLAKEHLAKTVDSHEERVLKILADLCSEGLIALEAGILRLRD